MLDLPSRNGSDEGAASAPVPRKPRRKPFVQVNESGLMVALWELQGAGRASWMLLWLVHEARKAGSPIIDVNCAGLARQQGCSERTLARALDELEARGYVDRPGELCGRRKVRLLEPALAISLPEWEAEGAVDNPQPDPGGPGQSCQGDPDRVVRVTPTELSGSEPGPGQGCQGDPDRVVRVPSIVARAKNGKKPREEQEEREEGPGRLRREDLEEAAAKLPPARAVGLRALARHGNLAHFTAEQLAWLTTLADAEPRAQAELAELLADYTSEPGEGASAGRRVLAFAERGLLARIEVRVARGIEGDRQLESGECRALHVQAFTPEGVPMGTSTVAKRMDQQGVQELVQRIQRRAREAHRGIAGEGCDAGMARVFATRFGESDPRTLRAAEQARPSLPAVAAVEDPDGLWEIPPKLREVVQKAAAGRMLDRGTSAAAARQRLHDWHSQGPQRPQERAEGAHAPGTSAELLALRERQRERMEAPQAKVAEAELDQAVDGMEASRAQEAAG